MQKTDYATAIEKVHAKDIPSDFPSDWGNRLFTRQVSIPGVKAFQQFLLMQSDGINCLASGETIENVAFMARRRIAHEARPPHDFDEDLAGLELTFSQSYGGPCVIYQVQDSTGHIWGSGDTREDAAKEAGLLYLCARPRTELNLKQFVRASFAAPITRTAGRAGHTVYDGNTDSYREIGRAAKIVWKNTPALQSTSIHEFRRKFISDVLKSCRWNNDIEQRTVTFGANQDMRLELVFHQSRLTGVEAIRACFQAEQSKAQEAQQPERLAE